MTDGDFTTLMACLGRTDTVEIPRVTPEPPPPSLWEIIRDLDPFAVGVAFGLLLSVVLIVGGSWLLTVAGWAQ